MAETYSSRTLRELVRIVATRFLGMAIIFVVIVAAVAVLSLFAPKWYRSEVLLKAEPTRLTSPLREQPSSLREQVSLFVSTQRAIIMSDHVLASALMRLEYPTKAQNHSDWDEVTDSFFKDPAVDEYISKASEKLREFRKRVSVVTPGGPDATFTQTFKIRVDWPEIRTRKEAIELESLKDLADQDVDTSYEDLPKKERAAEECFLLAKWLVKAYMTRFSELQKEENKQATEFIKGAGMITVKAQLKKASTALANYSEELGADLVTVVSITGDQGIDSGIAITLNQIDLGVNKIDAQLAELTSLQKALVTELAKGNPQNIAVPDEIIKANPAIELLLNKMVELQLALNNLTPKFTEDYQDVSHRKQELKAGYQNIHDELLKQQQRTGYTIDKLKSSRANLMMNKASLSAKMAKLGKKTVEYKRLKQDVAAAQENLERENRHYLESERATAIPIFVRPLGDPGRPNPKDPRRPIVWLNILLACVAGMVLSFVYAFMADHFDHTIKGIDDAERYLGAPVLGSVPKLGRKIIRTR